MGHREILHRVSFAHVCGDALIGASAGLALYSAFPPIGLWWMTIPALALFISRIDEARAPRALTVTVAFGMSMWLPLIDWVPMAVGMKPAWFVLAFTQTLFLCGWVLFTRWTQLWSWARGPLMQALLYAITWAGVDAARSRWPWSGFPWGSVALPQVDSSLGPLAPYGGTTGSLVDKAAVALVAPILIGYTNLNDRDRVKNWLAIWRPGVGIDEKARYSKHVPVPFGEFIPFREFIASFATEAAQSTKDMEAGDETPLMRVPARDGRRVPVAVGICFEGAYPSVIGEGVARGGQMIVTPSNNYHFRSSGESAQQGQLLRMRAMEYSRSAVQSSTTGHSYVIRPDGSVLASTDTESVATLVADVPLRSSLTVTARAGETIPFAFMGLSLLIAASGWVSAIRWGIAERAARATTR